MALRCAAAVLVLGIVLWACGCTAAGTKDSGAAAGRSVVPVAVPDGGAVADGQPGEPTGPGSSELEKLALGWRQMVRLMEMPDPPYRTVEALGWQISDRARAIVAAYRWKAAERGKADLVRLKEMENPEDWWLKAPEAMRDLDRVAMSAERVALAAATLDSAKLRDSYAALCVSAERCLRAPVESGAAPVPAGASVPPAPAAVPASPAPSVPKAGEPVPVPAPVAVPAPEAAEEK